MLSISTPNAINTAASPPVVIHIDPTVTIKRFEIIKKVETEGKVIKYIGSVAAVTLMLTAKAADTNLYMRVKCLFFTVRAGLFKNSDTGFISNISPVVAKTDSKRLKEVAIYGLNVSIMVIAKPIELILSASLLNSSEENIIASIIPALTTGGLSPVRKAKKAINKIEQIEHTFLFTLILFKIA